MVHSSVLIKQLDALKGDHNLGKEREREKDMTWIISSYKLGDFPKYRKVISSQ